MTRNKVFSPLLACLLASFALVAHAGNPIVEGIGLTDPHGVVFGDRVYLYATHDFSPDSKNFVTKDWWVWSSTDLLNWNQAGTLKPEDTFLHRPSNECWAGFGARRNGKYYWYFSAGPREIGVVVADSPVGPWQDPLGKPLIAQGLTPTEQRDPDIFMDEDGAAYMIYGTFKYFLVRLNDDMISLAETPRRLHLDREFGPYGEGKTDDKPSLHKHNGLYYLSWSSFYATATNLYGPYAYKGSVIAPENVAPELLVDQAVRKYDLWHDRHGNFFTFHHQWYYVFNDKSLPGRHTHFRDACLAYVHYRDNGDIAPIRLDRIGVGQYDASQPRIEAEDYFDLNQAEVRDCAAGGFEVRGLKDGSWLFYPRVMNLKANSPCSLRVASTVAGNRIEIRENDAQGALLGSCAVPATGGEYQTITTALKNGGGTRNICLVVQGTAGETLRLDWLTFAAE